MRPPITVFVILLSLASSGCVSSHMKQFIGKDAVYIRMQDGDPFGVFDLPDGRRAFQYFWGGGTYTVPSSTRTEGQIELTGNTAYYSEHRLTTPGGTITREGCRITYLARWNAAKRGWIVEEIVYPKRLVC